MKTCSEREQSLLRHQTNKLIVHKCYGFQVGSVSLDVPTSQGPGWFRTSLRPQRQSWANICPGSSGDSIFRFLVREGERATADWATRVCVSVVRLHQRHFDPPPARTRTGFLSVKSFGFKDQLKQRETTGLTTERRTFWSWGCFPTGPELNGLF